ncbi:Protein-l-isoaspartate o-methyltransferase, partial [Globisporangium splendens]
MPLSFSVFSTSIGHQIGGDSHDALVDSLVKTNIVQKGSRLEHALRLVDRSVFTPEQFRNTKDAYVNRPLKIGVVATISTPQQHAQVLGFLDDHLQPGMKAIDIGSGSGILVAIMAHLVGTQGHVTGVDIVPDLVTFAKQNLANCLHGDHAHLLERTKIVESDGKLDSMRTLASEHDGYDCIHVGVAVATKAEAEAYLEFLKPGGGLLIPLGVAGVEQKLVKMTKHADGHVEKKDVMSVLCQPMLDEIPIEVVRETRTEKLARIEQTLTDWRNAFEAKHGRKPSREDLLSDPEAKQLFQDFAALRK